MTKDDKDESRYILAVIVAAAALMAYVAHDAGVDKALDAQDAARQTLRVSMSYDHFMEHCGEESLIRRKELLEGTMKVVLRQDKWLLCLNRELTKEGEHAKVGGL